MRQIVLDTETTGLETSEGHRIIEIGCVEIIGRRCTGRVLHYYLNPQRDSDQAALDVHGLTSEFLADKPLFSAVVEDFIQFVDGAELVIHNAPFDIGFLDHELRLLGGQWGVLSQRCQVLDTLVMARQMYPGQRVSLDALCRRFGIDNSNRELHGALLDARLLAEVYLTMTGGQVGLSLDGESSSGGAEVEAIRRLPQGRPALLVQAAGVEELARHESRLDHLDSKLEGGSLWRRGP
ncbi:DNA polymerase III subunit epsilon [Alcanivorax sp. 1008]|uniref:DNA polymerase III subunit epsilon n=1 Tax=Alcanivorax sp. 1008 TaxID=2816853 RepID=UPI001E12AD6F|nr:DNA polymerase III subunit epsilon [Alcanivorax sp. 1008]MCC1496405.1 DNA polymerase III subunit epsilon [Alcanivorax sp. 1008]